MGKYILIACFSGVLSSFAQILFKKSSMKKRTNMLGEYINLYVIGGYAITFGCMILMIIAYTGLPYKYGVVLESLVYFYVMILSRVFGLESITPKKVIGNALIVLGVLIFAAG